MDSRVFHRFVFAAAVVTGIALSPAGAADAARNALERHAAFVGRAPSVVSPYR